MQLSHSRKVVSAAFDDPNLVSAAGLVPVMKLAADAGLHELADHWLSVPTDKGANAGLKVASLVGGMVAGADSIDDMALLRHGAMGKLFNACYAPSTLGSFLRKFTFGHVRQLDAIASRFLTNLTNLATEAPRHRGTEAPRHRYCRPLLTTTMSSLMSTTRLSRSMVMANKARVTAIQGSADSTHCWRRSRRRHRPR